MDKHDIALTDVECMVVLDSLSMLIRNTEKNEIDKQIAERIRSLIFETVKRDKLQQVNEKAKYDKCGMCKWLAEDNKSSVGYLCENPDKVWRSRTACWHSRSCKACKQFEKKEKRIES